MSFTDIDYAYALLFLSSLLLVEGLYYLVRDARSGAQNAINRRLRLIAKESNRGEVLNRLRRNDVDPVSAVLARALPFVDRLLRQAGTVMTLRRFVALCLALALGGFALAGVLTPMDRSKLMLLALLAGFGGPMLVLAQMRRRRVAQFGTQLPEALDMMVRGLQAGHPISSALGLVASEMPDPVGSEFGIVVDEMTYGLDLHSALVNLAARVPQPDLQFFIVSVQIQHNTGGNLGEVLSNLATVIRDRFTMKAKVSAITAQGRSSAFIVGLMPFVSALMLNFINKDYFGAVLSDPLFVPMMSIAGGMMVVGHVVIYRLVRFRI